ncbi:MAG TPA: heavy metal translocating P-type ATPase [Actinomycetota bacterium]|nr:heavy metal translocating P-type ATPase [Actinomycetota bacterium]
MLLGLALAGLAGGLGAWLAGADQFGDRLLALTVAAGLVPLAVAVARALVRRQPGVDLIALLAMAGALALGEVLAGAVIAVMLASGRLLEAYAGDRARRELRVLLERAPRMVHRYQDGGLASPPLEQVRPGDGLLVKPGEVVPVDGLVKGPTAVLDESALTGEAELVERGDGDRVRSGVVNAGPPFDLDATSTAATSTYAGILRLVTQAQASRAPFVRLADRYALAFVPLTLAVAGAAWLVSGEATRALAVLVVATPCPLILAAPVAIVAGISRAARRGIVVKSGGALERLAAGRVLLFDKTGTLTAGAPVVAEVQAADGDGDELLALAASLDQLSQHVLAGAIVRAAADRHLPLVFPAEVAEEPGRGVRGRVGGHQVAVGKAAWAGASQPLPPWARRLRRRGALEGFSTVFVAVDGVLAGALAVRDPVRPDAARTLRELRRAGLRRVVLVTGDHPDAAELVGAAVGVDEVLAERSPAEKVEAARRERAAGPTIMVGDGINDAPALAAADVGVAMGARGATASSEAADVVLVVDRFDRLTEAIGVARRSRRIALQSVLAGMGLSLAAMGLAAAGLLAPVAGAVLQEAIDVAVIVNALRALGAGRVRRRRPPGASVALGQRFRAEHRELLALVDRVRAVADGLERLPPPQALAEATAVHRLLAERLLPHEEAEDALLYPVVAELLGGEDPTAPMSRAHAEIAHLTRLLGRVLADLGPAGPEPEDRTDLRRILYGLHAILRLHFAQEEEAYLSLLDHGGQQRATSA